MADEKVAPNPSDRSAPEKSEQLNRENQQSSNSQAADQPGRKSPGRTPLFRN